MCLLFSQVIGTMQDLIPDINCCEPDDDNGASITSDDDDDDDEA